MSRSSRTSRRPAARPEVDVTVVLVAHDGQRWLPDALVALAEQTVRPRRVVAVDTGSSDDTAALLAAATGTLLDRVVTVDRRTGFGSAVAQGLAAETDASGGPSALLWLLHDDCAPEPDALAALLAHAQDSPSAGLLGPKVRDWTDPRRLVEVGITTDRAGHRETGLERREWDQGQHDAPRDVLAVGTAGALIRRAVWDEVGGLDPGLPVFRDDLDLGWRVNAAGHRVVVVPQARVRHVRAATTGQRHLDAAPGSAEGIDRRNALFVLTAHAPLWSLPLLAVRLSLATVLRVLFLLLSRRAGRARDELAAAAGVLLHPWRLLRARRARSRTRMVRRSQLRPLFATSRARARARFATLADLFSTSPSRGTSRLNALGDPGPDTSAEFDDAGFDDGPGSAGLLRLLLWRPSVLVVVVLAAVTAVAARELLPAGGGVLAGGRLLPAPGGAHDLYEAYAASWHPTSVGSADPAPPWLALLGALSTLLLGKAWLAVDVLLLGSVPLAGLTAWWAAGAVTRRPWLRVWAGLTWALLPVATGSTGALVVGRLDTAVVQIALPPLLVAGGRLLTRDPSTGGWWRAWGLGLGLAVVTSFAPALWLLAVALLLPGALLGVLFPGRVQRATAARRVTAAAIVVAVPLGLLLPWSAAVLRNPAAALLGPGRSLPDRIDPSLPTWHLALLSPGGSGLPEVAATAGVLLAALFAVLRLSRRGLALGAWAAALVALCGAVVLTRLMLDVPSGGGRAGVWPGPALQVAGGCLLLAALVGGDGLRARLGRRSFGWRQLTAGVVVLAAAATPVLLAAAWLHEDGRTQLERGSRSALPAFARAELLAAPGLRVLSLRASLTSADGRVSYSLTTGAGDRLGSTETLPSSAQARALDDVVADLLTARGSDAAAALATRAVRYVTLPDDGSRQSMATTSALDQQPGLLRRTRGEVLLWEVTAPAGRLTVLSPAAAGSALGAGRALPPDLLRTQPALPLSSPYVPAGAPGRLLVLAEASDPGWHASVDGSPLLRRTAWGWATAFELPPAGGRVRVERDQGPRRTALLLQGAGLLAVAVLAVPGARRRRGLEDAPDVEEPAS